MSLSNKIKKQVICIHWGNKYGPDYINRLYGMVSRNLTPPFRFVCFCDNEQNIRKEVECKPLPPLDFLLPKTTHGIWQKSRLWNRQLSDLSGPVLFLDLDVVITESLDPFFEFGEEDDVVLSHNPSNPLERLGQTSVYRFPVGKLYPLLEQFSKNPKQIADHYRYEQRYVTRNAPGGIKFWPRPWVRHFRRNCRRPFPLNYWLPPKLENHTRIVIFPGALGPREAISGIYHEDDTQKKRLQHIVSGLKGDRRDNLCSHLRHYIQPTPWVAKFWKE